MERGHWNMRARIAGLALLTGLAFLLPAGAAELTMAPVPEVAGPLLGPVISQHRLELPGAPLAYEARFAERELADAAGKPLATLSATAYLRQPLDPARPVLFAFNGGPGASSSPLHFGAFGPRLIERAADGSRTLVDNLHTPLVDADLVFIDPVGTGFSRVLPGGDGQPFWSVDGDARAVLDLIRDWLRESGRTASPVYIAGESYGGFRLATLAKDAGDLNLAGLILISPLLDASASEEVVGNDLPHIFRLPSYAVAAWRHGKGKARSGDVVAVFNEAAAFAQSDYALALLQGARLPAAERQHIARRVADLTGLDVATVLEQDLRVPTDLFVDRLLADQGLRVGRLDARVTAPLPKQEVAGRPAAANDPSLGLGRSNVIISAPATRYFQQELGLPAGRDYVSLTLDVNFRWDFRPAGQGTQYYVNPTANIAALLRDKPGLRLLLVGGYYDLAVPVLAARYAIDHAGIPPDRFTEALFDAGHSPFEGESNRARMKAMLQGFIRGQ